MSTGTKEVALPSLALVVMGCLIITQSKVTEKNNCITRNTDNHLTISTSMREIVNNYMYTAAKCSQKKKKERNKLHYPLVVQIKPILFVPFKKAEDRCVDYFFM